MTSLDLFVQQVINGISLGSMYALIALGFTLVYGIMELINFSHFNVFMVGSFIAMYVLEAFGISGQSTLMTGWALVGVLLVALGVTMVGCGILGVAIERLSLRPLRGVKGPSAMITTIGVSYVLFNLVLLFLGADTKNYPNPLPPLTFAIGGAAPLVGREQELAMMTGRWEKARAGEGRAVLLLGEAGMGKSRLAQALHGRIMETPHSFVSWQCSAFHSGKALYPVIEYVRAVADIADEDAPAERLAKLSALLAATGTALDDVLPLFADLLNIPMEAGGALSALLPTQRRAATIAALADWLGRIAESKPLLLLVEDAHWIDATSLDLLNRVIASIGHAPIFALVTSRPGFSPPWIGAAMAGVVGLDRLSNAECESLVRSLAAQTAAPAAMIEQVISNSDGNPLFLEELSLAVFDQRRTGANIVPDSLQSSLMARLDQLGEAKTVAQTCAVLGRRFARPLLALVVDLDAEALDDQLAALVANDILYPVGRTRDARFEFKHALVRDAAYGSLLLSRRRELHGRCGRFLERDFPDVVETEPELLAHHFEAADLPTEASLYAEKAGDRAAASVSYAEAIAGYRHALEQNAKLPSGPDRDRRELALLLKLGPAQAIMHGPQSAEVRDTYARAEPLGRSVGDSDQLFQVVWGLWFNANIGRDLDVAAERAQQLIILGERSGDDSHQLEALHCRWSSAFFRGEYAKASDDSSRGVALYVAERHHRLHVNFGGHDPGVCACAVRGPALAAQGKFVAGAASIVQGVELAESLEHPHSICHVLMNATVRGAISRDQAAVHDRGGRLLTLATKYNFPPVRALASYLLRWAESEGGSRVGLEAMRAEFAHASAIAPFPLFFAGLLAEQLLRQGEVEAAVAAAEQALGLIRPVDVGMYLPEIHRLRGVGQMMLGDRAAGAEHLRRAREIAQRQSSALFEVRALASALRFGAGDAEDELQAALRKGVEALDEGEAWPDRAEAIAVLNG